MCSINKDFYPLQKKNTKVLIESMTVLVHLSNFQLATWNALRSGAASIDRKIMSDFISTFPKRTMLNKMRPTMSTTTLTGLLPTLRACQLLTALHPAIDMVRDNATPVEELVESRPWICQLVLHKAYT